MTDRLGVPAWARVGAAAMLAAVAMAGCTGAEPEPAPTSASTATESSSPTVTPTESPEPTETSALPPLPEEAKENTPEGAEAFIRYYFDVANVAYTTPMPGLLPELSDPACIACQEMEDRIAALAANAQRAETQPFQLTSMSALGGGAPGVSNFQVELLQPANRVIEDSGEVVAEGAELLKTGVMAAIWTGARWLFYDSGVQ